VATGSPAPIAPPQPIPGGAGTDIGRASPPATRLDLTFLREPRRILAVALIALSGAAVLVFLVVRGELAGADARAYWGAVRVWLEGGDPMHPPAPYLPYVYVPWSVPLFLPWALLPWDVAWFVWRGVNIVLLLWTAAWAYRGHPLPTALLLVVLAAPIAATLDTGNITLLCALAVWAAFFVRPRLGGGLWALATVLKWFPAPLWLVLPGRARLWGLAWMALAVLLSLATWPETVAQLELAIGFPRPFRLDYLLLLWALVPWVWDHPAWLDARAWPRAVANARDRVLAAWRGWRGSRRRLDAARVAAAAWLRRFLGLPPSTASPSGR
jgi:hypothetical protein